MDGYEYDMMITVVGSVGDEVELGGVNVHDSNGGVVQAGEEVVAGKLKLRVELLGGVVYVGDAAVLI